jgi:hypothetical protein
MAEEPTQFGSEQWEFIKKTRAAVKNDAKAFFAVNNWRNVTPDGGRNDSTLFINGSKKCTVDVFYVRPLVLWVPHLLISNHIPTCPYCKQKEHIDLVKSRWLNSPKVLYGLTSHKYLDSMLYFCTKCKRSFAGYNKRSLQLDANIVLVTSTTSLAMGMQWTNSFLASLLTQAARNQLQRLPRKSRGYSTMTIWISSSSTLAL